MKWKGVSRALKDDLRGAWPKRIIGLVVITFIILALFALAFETGFSKDVPIDIVNLDMAPDNASASVSTVNVIESKDTLVVSTVYRTQTGIASGIDDLKAGNVRAVIVFGSNFTSDIVHWLAAAKANTSAPPANLTVYIDGTNPTVPGVVQGEVQRAVMLTLAMKYHVTQPVSLKPILIYGANEGIRDFLAPAVVSLMIFVMTLMPFMLASADTDKDGEATGLSTADRIVGKASAATLIGMIQVVAAMLTLYLFPIMMGSDAVLLFVIFSLLGFASASFGALLSAASRRNPSAIYAALPLLIFPAILLSGLIIPVSSMPDYLQVLSCLYPLTFSIQGARQVTLDGLGFGDVWMQVAVLLVYSLVMLVLAWVMCAGWRKTGRGCS